MTMYDADFIIVIICSLYNIHLKMRHFRYHWKFEYFSLSHLLNTQKGNSQIIKNHLFQLHTTSTTIKNRHGRQHQTTDKTNIISITPHRKMLSTSAHAFFAFDHIIRTHTSPLAYSTSRFVRSPHTREPARIHVPHTCA